MLPENWMEIASRQLNGKGAFLMVRDNPMTIGWAQFGILWRIPVATVYVRRSRYTHELLKDSDCFTISVPEEGVMNKELAFCGCRSGRDVHKAEALGLSVLPGKFGGQGGLSGCRFHVECKILHRTEIPEHIIEEPALIQRFYKNGDPHTQYIGRILGVYED